MEEVASNLQVVCFVVLTSVLFGAFVQCACSLRIDHFIHLPIYISKFVYVYIQYFYAIKTLPIFTYV
jgi:hypothetical protein